MREGSSDERCFLEPQSSLRERRGHLGDIEKCHDRLAWGAAIRGFLRRGISLSHAAAIFRIMRCPILQLRVGSCSTRPLERTRSALTGNPLASCIARISVEDSLSLARHEFRSSFELQESMFLDAPSWSDNLACIAQTPEAAAANLARWGQYLFTVFHMKLKPSSMIIVPAGPEKLGRVSWLSAVCGGGWLTKRRSWVDG